MRVRAVVLLVLAVLFPILALAQETAPWETRPLELEPLREALTRTVKARDFLSSGERGKAVDLLGIPIPEDRVEEWTAAVRERAAALTDLVAAVDERANGRTREWIDDELSRAEVTLEDLRRGLEAGVDPAASRETIVVLQARLTAAEAEVARARAALETRTRRIGALSERVPGFEDRIADLEARLEEADAAPGDELEAYRQVTDRIRLLAEREWREIAPDALSRWSRLLTLRQTELAVAEAKVRSVNAELAAARAGDLNRAIVRKREAEERAEATGRAAEAADDVLRRFALEIEKRIALAEAAAAAARITLLREVEPRVEEEEAENRDLLRSWEALRDRFAPDRGVSSRTPQLLLTSLKRVERNRQQLDRTLVPDLAETLAEFADDRAEVQDQLLELTMKPEDGPPGYLRLLAALPAERHAEAREAWIAAMAHRKTGLEALDQELGRVILALEKLGAIYDARRALLEEMNTFVVSRIYWVRNEDPVGLETLLGVRDEVTQIVLTYTGAPLRKGLVRAAEEGKLRFALLFLVFVGLIVLGAFIIRRLRSYRKRWDYRGGPVLVALQRVLVTILLASLAPGVLAIAAVLLGLLDLPPLLSVPGEILLYGIAIASFARRFLWNFFREDEGIAVTEFKAPPEVAAQLYRASGFVAFGFVAFALPWWILERTPLSPPLFHLPRIFWTLMLAFYAFVLLSLLRRRGAFMSALTRNRGFWHRTLFFLEPLLLLGFVGIVAMDLLGYRIGAARFTDNVVQTFLWGLVLIGLYNLLTSAVQHAATRVRQRKRKEVSAKEAFEKGREVFEQLSRFAGVTMIIVAVVVLGRFWGLGNGLEALLESVHVPKFPQVTLFDVVVALLWIGAGHFVIRNLPALYEVVLFPRMEKSDAGTRYVIVTISKYLVFLFAYASALLTLKFSFTSLGVVLAAVSVGIGFGLQEIVANFVSGLILFFERPVRVGDVVTVGTTVGTVERINIRATQVTNFDRQVMIIPNRQFIVEQVTNWTHNDLVIRGAVEVGVAYGTDVERVAKLLLEIVRAHPKVKRDPEPRFLFLGFGESSLNLRVWIYTEIEHRLATLSEIHSEISRRFKAEGVEIPFPQRDLHLRSVSDPTLLAALAPAPRSEPPAT